VPSSRRAVFDQPGNEIYAVAFSRDGTNIAVAGGRRDIARERFSERYNPDAGIRLWNPAGGEKIRVLTGHTGAVNALAFSPDGTTLASGSSDATIRLWHTAGGTPTGTPAGVLTGHTGAVNALAFSADGASMASTGTDQTIRLWQLPPTGAFPTRAVLSPPGPALPAAGP